MKPGHDNPARGCGRDVVWEENQSVVEWAEEEEEMEGGRNHGAENRCGMISGGVR